MVTGAPPIPRIELAVVPTPVLKLERLSQELGMELWVKRDDLTGLLETGNKIRKLEFLVGDAFARSADTLITCGTLQSNCCRTVAAVAARLGMKAILALKGAPPEEYDGNLLLDRLLGAEVRFCSDDEWGRIDELLEDLAARVRSRGGAPYIIPESGATVTGALGYVTCGEALETVVRVARLEGIVLDPVYTAKAFAALLDRIRRDPRELGPRVCFIHTGGIFSLFPYRRPLSRMLGGGGLVES